MKKGLKGFSLIEVLIATSIITIAVFGVYRLIGENTKIINNSGNYLQVNSLFPVLQECIENIGIGFFTGSKIINYDFNFGQNLKTCETGTSYDVEIDNLTYKLKGNITNSGSDFIDWELQISSEETKIFTKNYKQIK